MTAQRERRYVSVDEWLALERSNSEVKYEYPDGQLYLMSRESLARSRIGGNVVRTLEDAVALKRRRR